MHRDGRARAARTLRRHRRARVPERGPTGRGGALAGPLRCASRADAGVRAGRSRPRGGPGGARVRVDRYGRTSLEAAVAGWDRTVDCGNHDGRGSTWRMPISAPNRFAAAVAIAADVRETADRLVSPSLLAEADRLLRQARGRVAVDEPWRPLTAREFEVARLIGEGFDQRRDRRFARHRAEDGKLPRRAHPGQARGVPPHGDRNLGEQRRQERCRALTEQRLPTRNRGRPNGDGTIAGP